MQRKSFGAMQCPIARSLERVGEWWSILILRDAFHGLTHFAPEGASVQLADAETGAPVEPVVDAASGRRIAGRAFALVPGPAADEQTRARFERRRQRTAAAPRKAGP